MPILPIIDLLILMGWTALLFGFAQKAIWVTTVYRPHLLGLGPMDFVVIAGICLLFALTLAARAWLKANEPRLLEMRREAARAEARRRARVLEGQGEGEEGAEPRVPAMASVGPKTASADHR